MSATSTKRAMAMATRVVGVERVMVMAARAMVMASRMAGERQQQGRW